MPNMAGRGMSGYSGVDLAPEHLRGVAGEKIYQCHGTGQFGALDNFTNPADDFYSNLSNNPRYDMEFSIHHQQTSKWKTR